VAASHSRPHRTAVAPSPRPPTDYGGHAVSPPEERLGVARIQITMSDATPVGRFSRAHPEAQLVFTATQFLSPDRVLTEVEVFSRDQTDYTEEISRLPDVLGTV
jgi:hypothetical protein